MKKNIFSNLFIILIVFAGLMLFSCEESDESENGIGTIKLTNTSNVSIIYWSIQNGGRKEWETRSTIVSGSSASHDIASGSYTIYLEDSDADGWVSNISISVRKDEITEVKFPSDFRYSN